MTDARRHDGVARAIVALGTAVCAVLALCAGAAGAAEYGPMAVVRQFCQADSRGHRATIRGGAAFAQLVEWPLEPAWDHVVLINGYTIDSPRPFDPETLEIDVHYDVIGQVSAFGFDTNVFTETLPFLVHTYDGTNWRILGPPPPPHIAVIRVDVQAMRASFESGSTNFLPNSLFVAQTYRSAGWPVPALRTADLLSTGAYRLVTDPAVGDLVLFLNAGTPYHVGVLDEPDVMVSSTLNAGVVRTPIDAFPGEVVFARLVQPDGGTAALGLAEAAAAADAALGVRPPTPAPTVAPPRRPTPKPVRVSRSKPVRRSAVKRSTPVARKPKHGATRTPTPRKSGSRSSH